MRIKRKRIVIALIAKLKHSTERKVLAGSFVSRLFTKAKTEQD